MNRVSFCTIHRKIDTKRRRLGFSYDCLLCPPIFPTATNLSCLTGSSICYDRSPKFLRSVYPWLGCHLCFLTGSLSYGVYLLWLNWLYFFQLYSYIPVHSTNLLGGRFPVFRLFLSCYAACGSCVGRWISSIIFVPLKTTPFVMIAKNTRISLHPTAIIACRPFNGFFIRFL